MTSEDTKDRGGSGFQSSVQAQEDKGKIVSASQWVGSGLARSGGKILRALINTPRKGYISDRSTGRHPYSSSPRNEGIYVSSFKILGCISRVIERTDRRTGSQRHYIDKILHQLIYAVMKWIFNQYALLAQLCCNINVLPAHLEYLVSGACFNADYFAQELFAKGQGAGEKLPRNFFPPRNFSPRAPVPPPRRGIDRPLPPAPLPPGFPDDPRSVPDGSLQTVNRGHRLDKGGRKVRAGSEKSYKQCSEVTDSTRAGGKCEQVQKKAVVYCFINPLPVWLPVCLAGENAIKLLVHVTTTALHFHKYFDRGYELLGQEFAVSIFICDGMPPLTLRGGDFSIGQGSQDAGWRPPLRNEISYSWGRIRTPAAPYNIVYILTQIRRRVCAASLGSA
ncbi:hypothetical protein J6590_018060 [Homalodisca vitripennis]|nr:hypothetical protein J6590_018060 [Homalodisca vitripennis]